MVRSGLNPTAAVAAGEQVAEKNAQTQMDSEAKANQSRLQGLAGYQGNVLDASAKPEQMEQGLTQTEMGGADSALGTENQAAQTPSFWQELGQGAISGAGQFAANKWCPAEGSLYLLADGRETPVEHLKVGDELMGIDGDAQKIESIESALARILLVRSDQGHKLRNSWTHAYALPGGGFTVAARSMGKKLVADRGPARVISVQDGGVARVFNVITGGSHTYRADGVWALGVGEAERYVSMDEWQRIGDQLMQEVV